MLMLTCVSIAFLLATWYGLAAKTFVVMSCWCGFKAFVGTLSRLSLSSSVTAVARWVGGVKVDVDVSQHNEFLDDRKMDVLLSIFCLFCIWFSVFLIPRMYSRTMYSILQWISGLLVRGRQQPSQTNTRPLFLIKISSTMLAIKATIVGGGVKQWPQ